MHKQFLYLTLLFYLINLSLSQAQDWEFQHPVPQPHDLTAIHFIDNSTGWAGGAYGTILYTTFNEENTRIPPSNLNGESPILLYPNPVTEILHIKVPGAPSIYDLEVRDLNGQLIKYQQITGPNASIRLDGIPAGQYLLTLSRGEKRYTHKFTVLSAD